MDSFLRGKVKPRDLMKLEQALELHATATRDEKQPQCEHNLKARTSKKRKGRRHRNRKFVSNRCLDSRRRLLVDRVFKALDSTNAGTVSLLKCLVICVPKNRSRMERYFRSQATEDTNNEAAYSNGDLRHIPVSYDEFLGYWTLENESVETYEQFEDMFILLGDHSSPVRESSLAKSLQRFMEFVLPSKVLQELQSKAKERENNKHFYETEADDLEWWPQYLIHSLKYYKMTLRGILQRRNGDMTRETCRVRKNPALKVKSESELEQAILERRWTPTQPLETIEKLSIDDENNLARLKRMLNSPRIASELERWWKSLIPITTYSQRRTADIVRNADNAQAILAILEREGINLKMVSRERKEPDLGCAFANKKNITEQRREVLLEYRRLAIEREKKRRIRSNAKHGSLPEDPHDLINLVDEIYPSATSHNHEDTPKGMFETDGVRFECITRKAFQSIDRMIIATFVGYDFAFDHAEEMADMDFFRVQLMGTRDTCPHPRQYLTREEWYISILEFVDLWTNTACEDEYVQFLQDMLQVLMGGELVLGTKGAMQHNAMKRMQNTARKQRFKTAKTPNGHSEIRWPQNLGGDPKLWSQAYSFGAKTKHAFDQPTPGPNQYLPNDLLLTPWASAGTNLAPRSKNTSLRIAGRGEEIYSGTGGYQSSAGFVVANTPVYRPPIRDKVRPKSATWRTTNSGVDGRVPRFVDDAAFLALACHAEMYHFVPPSSPRERDRSSANKPSKSIALHSNDDNSIPHVKERERISGHNFDGKLHRILLGHRRRDREPLRSGLPSTSTFLKDSLNLDANVARTLKVHREQVMKLEKMLEEKLPCPCSSSDESGDCTSPSVFETCSANRENKPATRRDNREEKISCQEKYKVLHRLRFGGVSPERFAAQVCNEIRISTTT